MFWKKSSPAPKADTPPTPSKENPSPAERVDDVTPSTSPAAQVDALSSASANTPKATPVAKERESIPTSTTEEAEEKVSAKQEDSSQGPADASDASPEADQAKTGDGEEKKGDEKEAGTEAEASNKAALSEMLPLAAERGASDLMITPGRPPMLRLHGKWIPTHWDVLDEDDVHRLLSNVAEAARRDPEEIDEGFDAAIQGKDGTRFRVNIFRHTGTYASVLRTIPQSLPTLEELGLPHVIQELAAARQGLVLVTGATGHGKSTTLAKLIDIINQHHNRHIITLEDPIEFIHQNQQSIIHQREMGVDASDFADGLRAALRQSPDVILVGEMRDLEAIQAALTAAETGHLVLATLHTNSATDTISRIIDVFPGAKQEQVRTQLAASLKAVFSQVLVPKIGGGRALAYEVMISTSGIRNKIRQGDAHQITSDMQTGVSQGMTTLEMTLADLYRTNQITLGDANLVARHPKTLEGLLREER